MQGKNMEEHFCKDVLKKIVDNSKKYLQNEKEDLKVIIDESKTVEEMVELMLIYFAGKRNNLF